MKTCESLDETAASVLGSIHVSPLLDNYAFLTRALIAVLQTSKPAHFPDGPVSQGKVLLLCLLHLNEGVSQKALAKAMSIKKAALAIMLDQLAAEGLVERATAEGDRRLNAVRLTPKGRAFAQDVRERAAQHNDAFLAPLESGEREELVHLLKKLLVHHGQLNDRG